MSSWETQNSWLKRESVLLFLSFLSGAFVTTHLAAAQARFLEQYSATHLVYIFSTATLLMAVILRVWGHRDWTIRFGYFSSVILVLLTAALITVIVLGSTSNRALYIYMFLASLLPELFRWILMEHTERHVNPALTGRQLASQSVGYEIGKLSGILVFSIGFKMGTPILLTLSVSIIGSMLGLILFGLGRKQNVERRLGPSVKGIKKNLDRTVSRFTVYFILGGLLWGFSRLVQESAVKEVFRTQGDALAFLINASLAAEAILALSLNFIYRHWIEGRRLSPFLVMNISWALVIFGNLAGYWTQSIWVLVLLTSLHRGLGTFYFPSIIRIFASFELKTRLRLQAQHAIASGILAGLLASGVLAAAHMIFEIKLGTSFLLAVAGVSCVSFYILFQMRRYFRTYLNSSVGLSDPAVAIPAIVGLSYLRTRDFVPRMEQILAKDPKAMLKKTVLLGLGFAREPRATEVLKREFESDREEIQLTVLESMKIAADYDATRFALELVLSNRAAISPHVRLSAARLVASVYGRKSIPILMLGLSEEDPRQLANIIEALATFDDRALVVIFKQHSESSFPRLRANALLGLSRFPEERPGVVEQIRKTLERSEAADLTSILYVVGRYREKEFQLAIAGLLSRLNLNSEWIEDPERISYGLVLMWSGVRLKVPAGAQLWWKYLTQYHEHENAGPWTHFFKQLDDAERFDCMDRWIWNAKDRRGAISLLEQALGRSGFDFVDEIQFLMGLRRTYRIPVERIPDEIVKG